MCSYKCHDIFYILVAHVSCWEKLQPIDGSMKESKILITNDDGIESPGLKGAVEADLDLGTVTVVALVISKREQVEV